MNSDNKVKFVSKIVAASLFYIIVISILRMIARYRLFQEPSLTLIFNKHSDGDFYIANIVYIAILLINSIALIRLKKWAFIFCLSFAAVLSIFNVLGILQIGFLTPIRPVIILMSLYPFNAKPSIILLIIQISISTALLLSLGKNESRSEVVLYLFKSLAFHTHKY